MKNRNAIGVAVLLLLVIAGGLIGYFRFFRAETIAEKDRAVFRLKLDIESLENSELLSGTGLKFNDLSMNDFVESNQVSFSEVKSINGYLGIGSNWDDMSSGRLIDNKVGFNFLVELTLKEGRDAKNYLEIGDLLTECDVESWGGKKYYVTLRSENAPKDLAIHFPQSNQVIIGTRDFVLRNNRDIETKSLKQTWKQLADAPVQFAADMSTHKEFFRQIANDTRLDPFNKPFVDTFDDMQQVTYLLTPDQPNVIQLRVTSDNEDSAEEIEGLINGLLGMAKLTFNGMVSQSQKDLPEASATLKKLIQGLAVNREGTTISLNVAKPKGLRKAIIDFVELDSRFRELEQRQINMEIIASAVQRFHGRIQQRPFDVGQVKNMTNDLSWRVRILQFMGSAGVVSQVMDWSEPWDAEINLQFQNEMPDVFGNHASKSSIVFVSPEKPPFNELTENNGAAQFCLIEYPSKKSWIEPETISRESILNHLNSLSENEMVFAVSWRGAVMEIWGDQDESYYRVLLNLPEDEE